MDALVAADFYSINPQDNRVSCATYFERCWPNNESISGYDFSLAA